MGQGQSVAPRPRSHEELVKELANRFAVKCFSSLELYCLKDNFRSLADSTREQYHPSVGGGDGSTADKDHDDGEHSGEEHGHGNDNAKENDGDDGVVRRARVVRYLKEDTLARFLELPDALGVSPVIFQMISFLGAFPFLSEAPAVLGLEQLVIVVTLLTDRYRRVLANGAADRNTLLFRSLAVHDRKLFAGDTPKQGGGGTAETPAAAGATQTETSAPGNPSDAGSSTLGFAVDCAVDDGDEDGGEGEEDSFDHLTLDELADDDLAAAALEAFDYVDPSARARRATPRRPPGTTLHGARIPADNFRKLLLLLILVAPLDAQEHLSMHASRVTGAALASLRASAECILATFLDVETSPGITFTHFQAVLPVCFPYLFNGFSALFEHFLFSKNLDLSRTKAAPGGGDSTGNTAAPTTAASTEAATAAAAAAATPAPPLLLRETDDTILDLNLLSQLSFFLPGSSLFHRLRLLYAGGNDGFSLGSFETKVFNWRAPSILLVKGTRISEAARGGQEATFAAALPPRRLPNGNGRTAKQPGGNDDDDDDDETLIFGAYVSQPWRLTNRECFGDSDVVLFQLSPVHDVFGASALRRDYVAFVKPTAANNHAGGIGFGCPLPTTTAAKAQQSRLGGGPGGGLAAMEGVLPLGPLSLMIDANLEYGVLTHEWSEHGSGGGGGGGGTFHTSVARTFGFQDRFAIEALEVWGCGGDAEARVQAERWAWEAREAEARRRINLGTGDIEADRALLEMAGIIGGSRSGGSMG